MRKSKTSIFQEEDNWLSDALTSAASRLSPLADDKNLSRALQWKAWLRDETKTKFDLYEELSKAPLPLTYVPGAGQMAFHKDESRVRQVAGGWRAGKSKSMAAEILPLMFQDGAKVWIVAPDYELAKPEFEYVYEWLHWLGAPLEEKDGGQVSMPLNGRYVMRLPWGAELMTKSAEDVRKLEAGNLDCAAIAEGGLIDIEALDKLRGRVMEKAALTRGKSGKILISGSMEGAQWWYIEQFEKYLHGSEDGDWKSFSIPSWENKIIFPGGEEDPEIIHLKNTLPEDLFTLKVAARVAKPQELVFPEFSEKEHILPIEWSDRDPEGLVIDAPHPIYDEAGWKVIKWLLPSRSAVELAIDPGFNGAYAVEAVQKFGNDVFVIDEVYLQRIMAEDVIKECKTRWWWPYCKSGVIDIAGNQHDAMESHVEVWAKETGIYLRSQYVPIVDGITRMRTFLKDPMTRRPRIWFSPRAKGAIREFNLYKYRVAKENRAVREDPVDAHNHAIKALIYYLIDRFTWVGMGDKRVTSERYIKSARLPWHEGSDRPGYDPFGMP